MDDVLIVVFGNDEGELYEATLGDLSEGNLIRLDRKTNIDEKGQIHWTM